MNVLILSCGTGGGHNTACMALKQEFTARGHGVTDLNPYLLKSEKTAGAVNGTYIFLATKAPTAFGFVYGLGNVYRRLPFHSPVYRINLKMTELLENYLNENIYDAIVATHLFPAEILTGIKRRGAKLPPTYFVATDYTCIPFTEETECDGYVIPSSELAEEFAKRGISKQKLLPLGIPTRREFAEKLSRKRAKAKLGFDPARKLVLIAGGSIGAGKLSKAVSLLSRRYGKDISLAVICGSNKQLYDNLKSVCPENVILIEYTEYMADYIHACDVFVSKPGGLSSTEAAVAGTALLHLHPIPGCETRNSEFFVRHGMSVCADKSGEQVPDLCDFLLNGHEREKMIENQRKSIPENSSRKICDHIETCC